MTIAHRMGSKAWDGQSDRFSPVYNPATGEQTAQVRLADATDVDAVVTAASDAFGTWRHSSLSTRTRIMFAFRELLKRGVPDLARCITAEHGKTVTDAEGEITRGLEVVEFACGIPQLLKGEYSERVSTGTDVCSIRQPLGVAAGITPFNFPAMVPMWMFPIAIACGNCFVLKPSERDPSAALMLADWFSGAGLPDGVFNVIQGDRVAVDALLAHPGVAAVSFVGSTPIARHVYRSAAASGKRVQALGGAKNHMIVLPDADLDRAADAAVSAGYGSAGERCMAVSVVVAVDPVGDALVERIAERTRDLIVGDGTDAGVDMGPLVTAEHRDRVRTMVDTGVAEGAALVVDGRGLTVPDRPGGHWLGPCLFDRVTPEMEVYRQEIFGPVLCVVRAGSYDEAVGLVADNPWGNGVALFTSSGAAARRFQLEVEAGMVGLNVPIPVPVSYHSFGGWGDSLFGDTHVYGPDGVRFYTRGKVVTARWSDPRTGAPDLGFPAQ
ncbi:MAG: putative 3-oxopropanoate dehydrogenase [Acidimicrobiales bacterium]|nr:MAG: CoA-acylating methylmalonate-semialdehyde dehydrogenase [Actinomycetota bacterium]MBV6509378.1 putative 3-oxopropanoate dehydrogenase [Acidimicrobiales bacterium]RIK04638.1 MAG: methylmalonate-semialdehyde dehydrogenase (CoA acylating) [Acidobacteriota bacterium]